MKKKTENENSTIFDSKYTYIGSLHTFSYTINCKTYQDEWRKQSNSSLLNQNALLSPLADTIQKKERSRKGINGGQNFEGRTPNNAIVTPTPSKSITYLSVLQRKPCTMPNS